MYALVFCNSCWNTAGSIRSPTSSCLRRRYSAASWLTASRAKAPDPRAGSHSEVKDGVGRHVLGEEFRQCLRNGETGEHLRRVVRSRLLSITAGQPEDEAASAVHSWLLLTCHLIDLTDEVISVDVLGPCGRYDPAAFARVSLRSDLIEVRLCEEACVGHQTLIDSTELVDAEFSVGDEPAVLLRRLLAQEQLLQHLLQDGVAQTHLVDMGCRLRGKQISFERMELQALTHRRFRIGFSCLGEAEIIVSGLDLGEQDGQGLVQVRPVTTSGDIDEREVPQTVDAVSRLVVGGSGGHDFEFRRGLGEEKEQDPVEVPQSLFGQRLSFLCRQRIESCATATLDDLVGDELD